MRAYVNRAQACVRVTLWLLPTGFAFFSAWAGNWLFEHSYVPQLGVSAWMFVNTIFVVGTGWFNALLSPHARAEPNGASKRIILFFVIQVFLIPVLLATLLYLACVIDPVKLGGH